MRFNPKDLEIGKAYDYANAKTDEKLIVIDKNEVAIKNLVIDGEIVVKAENVTLECCHAGTVTLCGAKNVLVAQCTADSVSVKDCFNCSLILNTANELVCKRNVNVYVIDNTVNGALVLDENNYIIANGNSFDDIRDTNNKNSNGDTLTDINARPEFGANEDIIPHTNKELFVGMPRRKTVVGSDLCAWDYIAQRINSSDIVILPPAAYEAWGGMNVSDQAFVGKTIYAYGAYYEFADTVYANYPAPFLMMHGTRDVKILGLTLGYTLPSSGQVRVVEKITDGEKYKVRVIADAGFMDGLGKSDLSRYMSWWVDIFLNDEKTGKARLYCTEAPKGHYEIEQSLDENGNYDGTHIITLLDRGDETHGEFKPAKRLWDQMEKGNIITCRLAQTGKCSIVVSCSSNVLFRDCVLYGYTGGLAVCGGGQCDNVHFERFHNAVHSATLIDEETYDKYRALEEKWGVSFDIHRDELGRCRGAVSRSGSVDAFHMSSCSHGFNITATLVESMVDDANNQHGSSARLHGYKVNDDGTTTLIYKPFITPVAWGFHKHDKRLEIKTSSCQAFKAGHRVFIYNPYGRKVCDTQVLFDPITTEKSIDIDLTYDGVRKHVIRDSYAITVKTEDVDFEALIDYKTGKEFDLSDNGLEMTNRVTVDNLSFNCSGYTLDNVMVLNNRTRGFLIKATEVDIKHCTIRNVSGSGLLLRSESEWAESTIARNINIQQCLFDNIGYMFTATHNPERANIRIESTSTVASEGTLPINNIVIDRCKFTNNEQKYAIMVNSAKNVQIKGNVFDPIANECERTRGVAVLLKTCMNVEISENTFNYHHYNGDIRNVIEGKNYRNIFGSDVTDKNGNTLIPDNVAE